MLNISFHELRSKKTLIIGDVASGKTSLTKKLLLQAIESERDIAVLDMAPPLTEIDGLQVGGHLIDERQDEVRYLLVKDIKTPRLSAHSQEELIRLAEHNREIIEPLITLLKQNPSKNLFVNDVSIYLQRGNIETLWGPLVKAETVVANGYLGTKLQEDLGTGISLREKSLMEKLASKMDKIINLKS